MKCKDWNEVIGEKHNRGSSMTNKHADKGKVAEKQVQSWLEASSAARAGFAYHRMPDARSARGALAAQPADFLVALHGIGASWLEVKETANLTRLPKAKITQFGALLKFWYAGFTAYVVVYRSAHHDWTYFTGRELFCDEIAPSSFPFVGRPSFPTHHDVLQEIFG